jgi:hypothetical protein
MDAVFVSPLADGSVVVTGHNDLGIYSKDDMLIARLDADGNTVWALPAMGRLVRAIDTSDTHALLVHEVTGRVKIGTVEANARHSDGVFVSKVSLDGEPEWVTSFGTHDFDRAYDVAAAPDGGAFVASGAFVAGKVGNTAFTNAGGEDALVSRWSPDGRLVWLRTFDWKGQDSTVALVPRTGGGVTVLGTRCEKPAGGIDYCRIWAAALSPEGTTLWEREHGSRGGQTTLAGVAANRNGLLVIEGVVRGSATELGKVSLDPSNAPYFVAELSDDGNIGWVAARSSLSQIAVDDDGNVFGCSGGVFLLEQDTDSWLVRWEGEVYLGGCVAGPDRTLFVTGTAYQGAALGDVPIGPPRKRRFRNVPDVGHAFAAKLTY